VVSVRAFILLPGKKLVGEDRMDTFAKLFGRLASFVYLCFDFASSFLNTYLG
jgi:hypothetical protein